MLRRALSAHERLERIVLSERGLEGVAAALAAMIGGPALIFDARGELLRAARAREPRGDRGALGAELRERVRGGRTARLRARRGSRPARLALPVARPAAADAASRRPAGVADRGQGRRPAERARPARRCTRR